MSIDLTEAIEAAARLMHPGVFDRNAPDTQAECRQEARAIVTAAAPLIEAAVRAKVAEEIVAEARALDARTITEQSTTVIAVLQIKREGVLVAARIAHPNT